MLSMKADGQRNDSQTDKELLAAEQSSPQRMHTAQPPANDLANWAEREEQESLAIEP